MRILITNDDSVNASQLLPFIKWCKKLGEVTVCVPMYQQSGKSHGIEIHEPFKVEERMLDDDTKVYVVDSTPADCVRYAVLGLGFKFDLVISGVNCGYNIGRDMLYSGTVAAATEAAILGLPAIAFSTSFDKYENVVNSLDALWDYIENKKLLEKHSLYNVNISDEEKGIVITRQGGSYYSDSFIMVEEGYYKADGKCVFAPSDDLTLDTDAVISGYNSITPITIDMTDKKIFDILKN